MRKRLLKYKATENGTGIERKIQRSDTVRYACPCCGRKTRQTKFSPAGAHYLNNDLKSCRWCGCLYGHCTPAVSFSLVKPEFTPKKVALENCYYFLFIVVDGHEQEVRSGWFDRRSRKRIKASLFKGF